MAEALGLLRSFHTDIYCGPGSSLYPWRGALGLFRSSPLVRKMLERTSTLAAAKVRAHNAIGFAAKWRMWRATETIDRMRVHHWLDQRLSKAVARATPSPADITYGFRGASCLFEALKGRTVCVLDQIDGGIHAVNLVRREQETHLDWLSGEPDWLVCRRTGATWWLDIERPWLHHEWEIADHIICNSEWTRSCLVAEGVPAEKCSIVPLAYTPPRYGPSCSPPRPNTSVFRVAFLGTLSLGKGIHHLLEAARRAAVQFPVRVLVAGAAREIRPDRIRAYADVADYLGVLPRGDVPAFLRSCDALALPSLSEGFGIVQLEAMAAGLPVIASDHTGDVVRDGQDGFRVPAGDVEALAERLVRLARAPALCRQMGAAARERVKDFAPERVAGQWLAALDNACELTGERAVRDARGARSSPQGAARPSASCPGAVSALTSPFSTVDVIQIGVRRHYAVPLMAESLGLLRTFHTDAYCGPGSLLYPWRGALEMFRGLLHVQKLLERTSGLPAAKIRAHNALGLAAKWRMLWATQTMERMRVHHDLAARLNAAVVRATPVPADVTYGFRGADSLFAALRGRTLCVLDQIDGGIREVQIMRAEQAAHLEWLPGEPDWRVCERTGAPWWFDIEAARLRREWELADHIICNSEWTRSCLVAEGVSDAKCSVVPLSYKTPSRMPAEPEPAADGPLRIAFLGSLTLRKGIHYALEAARRAVRMAAVRVVIAGPAGDVRPERVRQYADVADFRGVVPRGEVPAFLRSCGALVLPSISEGFGIVQLEAMAQGLPVVGSDRTGEVVRDGIDGFRVPAGDVDALADRFVRLARDPALRRRMGMSARERVKDFEPERVARQWRAALETAWNIREMNLARRIDAVQS